MKIFFLIFCSLGFSLKAFAQTEVSPALLEKLKAIPEEYVVVSVWSPFCAPCGQEVTELTQVLGNANQAKKRLSVIGVAAPGYTNASKTFLEHFQPVYEQWTPDHTFQALITKHGALPWTLLFGKDRRLLREWTGAVSASVIAEQINSTDVYR